MVSKASYYGASQTVILDLRGVLLRVGQKGWGKVVVEGSVTVRGIVGVVFYSGGRHTAVRAGMAGDSVGFGPVEWGWVTMTSEKARARKHERAQDGFRRSYVYVYVVAVVYARGRCCSRY